MERAKMLTDTELELMNILWKLEGGTVRQVLAELPENRKLAYTSVSTILRILEQKEFLVSEKQGRGHLYRPLVAKDSYEQLALHHMVENVFSGTPASLAKALIESKSLKASDIEDLKKLLEERLS